MGRHGVSAPGQGEVLGVQDDPTHQGGRCRRVSTGPRRSPRGAAQRGQAEALGDVNGLVRPGRCSACRCPGPAAGVALHGDPLPMHGSLPVAHASTDTYSQASCWCPGTRGGRLPTGRPLPGWGVCHAGRCGSSPGMRQQSSFSPLRRGVLAGKAGLTATPGPPWHDGRRCPWAPSHGQRRHQSGKLRHLFAYSFLSGCGKICPDGEHLGVMACTSAEQRRSSRVSAHK